MHLELIIFPICGELNLYKIQILMSVIISNFNQKIIRISRGGTAIFLGREKKKLRSENWVQPWKCQQKENDEIKWKLNSLKLQQRQIKRTSLRGIIRKWKNLELKHESDEENINRGRTKSEANSDNLINGKHRSDLTRDTMISSVGGTLIQFPVFVRSKKDHLNGLRFFSYVFYNF